MDIFRVAYCANNDTAILGHDNGGLGSKFILLMRFTLTNAVNLRLVQAVNFVFRTPYLL